MTSWIVCLDIAWNPAAAAQQHIAMRLTGLGEHLDMLRHVSGCHTPASLACHVLGPPLPVPEAHISIVTGLFALQE